VALQTLTVDVRIVPGRAFQTQDGLRRSIIGVFEADVTSNDDQRVVDRLTITQRTVQRYRQLWTIYN